MEALMYCAARVWANPRIMAPTNVPRMLPKPPKMTTPKAMIRNVIPESGVKGKVKPRKTPPTAAIAAAIPKVKANMRVVLIPIN